MNYTLISNWALILFVLERGDSSVTGITIPSNFSLFISTSFLSLNFNVSHNSLNLFKSKYALTSLLSFKKNSSSSISKIFESDLWNHLALYKQLIFYLLCLNRFWVSYNDHLSKASFRLIHLDSELYQAIFNLLKIKLKLIQSNIRCL